MSLESKLKNLCDNIDGAVSSFFCGYDGMMIGSVVLPNNKIDIDFLAANFASVINNVNKSHEIVDIIFTLKENVVAIKALPDGFVGVVLNKDGNLGRCKLELNKVGNILGS